MCSHYEPPRPDLLIQMFGQGPDQAVQDDFWPGYTGPFVRLAQHTDPYDEAAPTIELLAGVFGLLPFWTKDSRLANRTHNARAETVATKPSYRSAWRRAQHCLIPAQAFYEPDWRSGKAVPTRISRADGQPMCIAGLWERWINPTGDVVHSYTMLTINADDHTLMQQFHRPGKEKRMVVILPNTLFQDWLAAPAYESMEFMRPYPADRLLAEAHALR